MRFSSFIVKNLRRRPFRSVLTVISISVAVGAVVALVGISVGFQKTYSDLYDRTGIDILILRSKTSRRMSLLDESLEARLRAIPGVVDVVPGLVDTHEFAAYGKPLVLVNGFSPGSRAMKHHELIDGRSLQPGDTTVVLLGEILAADLGKKVGDTLEMYSREYQVIGIYRSFSVFENGYLIIPLKQLQEEKNEPGKVTGFSLVTANSQDEEFVRRIMADARKLDPQLDVFTSKQHIESLQEIKLAQAMAWLTSAVALIIGAVGVMNTMYMSIHERTREIGVLRAIGWQRGRVLRMILAESECLSLFGAAAGILGGYALVRLLTSSPMVNGLIEGQIQPDIMVLGLIIAMVVGLLGGIMPALRAANMLPSVALREE